MRPGYAPDGVKVTPKKLRPPQRSQSIGLAEGGSGSPAAQRTGAQREEGETRERERARLGHREQLLRVDVAAGEGTIRKQHSGLQCRNRAPRFQSGTEPR